MPLQLLLNVKLTEPSFIFNLTIFLKLHSRLFSTWPTRDERRNVITKREISIFWSKEKRVTESIWIQLYNSILNAVFLFGSRALAEEMEKNDRRARGFHLFAAVLFLLLSPHFVFTFASSLLLVCLCSPLWSLQYFDFNQLIVKEPNEKRARVIRKLLFSAAFFSAVPVIWNENACSIYSGRRRKSQQKKWLGWGTQSTPNSPHHAHRVRMKLQVQICLLFNVIKVILVERSTALEEKGEERKGTGKSEMLTRATSRSVSILDRIVNWILSQWKPVWCDVWAKRWWWRRKYSTMERWEGTERC